MYQHDSWHAGYRARLQEPKAHKITKLRFALLETAQNVIHVQQAALLDFALFRKPATR
jgi:hypothetical protein